MARRKNVEVQPWAIIFHAHTVLDAVMPSPLDRKYSTETEGIIGRYEDECVCVCVWKKEEFDYEVKRELEEY